MKPLKYKGVVWMSLGDYNDKFSKEYPLGEYLHIDVCKTKLKPTDLEGKLKHCFASCISRSSYSHRTYYIHADDLEVFNETSKY